MALLGLDAPEGEHGLAADVYQVDAHGQRDGRAWHETKLAGADKDGRLVEPMVDERAAHHRERIAKRKRDMVREHQRRRAGAALTSVDVDEVGALFGPSHLRRELTPERRLTERPT